MDRVRIHYVVETPAIGVGGVGGHKGKAKIRYFLGVCLEPLGAPCVLLRCAILIKAGVW